MSRLQNEQTDATCGEWEVAIGAVAASILTAIYHILTNGTLHTEADGVRDVAGDRPAVHACAADRRRRDDAPTTDACGMVAGLCVGR